MKYKKLSIDEQIELIKSKNIAVSDESKKQLNDVNYYNLMSFKNIFYENKDFHKYKQNLKLSDFYSLYQIDSEIKKELLFSFQLLKTKLIKRIIDLFKNNFFEKDYLKDSLYKKNIIIEIYNTSLNKGFECQTYYNTHSFLPIWVLLNEMEYSQFIDYIESFNFKQYKKAFQGIKIRDLHSTKIWFEKVISGNRIYDFSYKNTNINDILKILKRFDINIENICLQYKKIYLDIPIIKKEDVLNIVGIKEEYLNGQNQ